MMHPPAHSGTCSGLRTGLGIQAFVVTVTRLKLDMQQLLTNMQSPPLDLLPLWLLGGLCSAQESSGSLSISSTSLNQSLSNLLI